MNKFQGEFFLPITDAINSKLLESGIRYIHWKSNIHLANALRGETDLDLLIHIDDKEEFLKIIKKYLFIQVISPTWCKYLDIEDYVGCDRETGIMLHLHVHYQMLTGFKRVKHFHLPWEEKILDSRMIDKETCWPTPTHVDEFIVFILRMQLKSTLGAYLSRVNKYPNHVKDEYIFLAKKVDHKSVSKRLLDFNLNISDGDIKQLLLYENFDNIKSISNSLIRQISNGPRHKFIITLWLSFIKGLRYWYARRNFRKHKLSRFKKVLKGNGIVVAFIGVDGSGKSSITNTVYEWLIPKVDAHLVYLGSGDGAKGSVESVRSRLRNKVPLKNKKSSYLRTIIRSIFDVLLLFRKVILIIKSKKISKKGSVVIMDRFPQNQFFGINDGPKVHNYISLFPFRMLEKILFGIVEKNKPDLVFRLNIDFETSMIRKPDHDPLIIKEKVRIINKINFDRVIEIDATQPLSDVVLLIKEKIWQELSHKEK